jgi:hypothetical protein
MLVSAFRSETALCTSFRCRERLATLGVEPMRGAWLDQGKQIEVFPDLDELALADIAHQDDGQVELCTRSDLVGRCRPLIGDHSRVHIFPAEFRPVRIGEDVCRLDAQAVGVIPRGHGSCRQLANLVKSAERFTGGHDHPRDVGSNEVHEAFDVVGGKRGRERLEEVLSSGIRIRFRCSREIHFSFFLVV